MYIKPLKTEKDYKKALNRIDELFNAKPNTQEGDELEILITLVEAYEQKHYTIEAPDPIEAIKHVMESQGLKQVDVVNIFGSRSKTSEILNKKRKLSLKMIRKASEIFNIPAKILKKDY